MGPVWLIWLDFDSNTGGGGGREEEGSGEPEEPEIYTSVAGFVRHSPQATQVPQGSAGNGLGFENGPNKIWSWVEIFFALLCPEAALVCPARPMKKFPSEIFRKF